jgi:hypothetical protein
MLLVGIPSNMYKAMSRNIAEPVFEGGHFILLYFSRRGIGRYLQRLIMIICPVGGTNGKQPLRTTT